MKSFRGRKSLGGSTPKPPTRLDDNLFGTDTVEVILAVSEGPCQGIVEGASGFLVADVPLVDPGTDTPNISNFELRVLKGTTPADSILPNLGGIGSSRTIGLDLRTKMQQAVGAGQLTQIDYIDLRFTVGRLFLTNDRGDEANTTLSMKVELKPRSSTTWQVPFTNEPPPTEQNTAGASNYRPGATQPGSIVNAAYHETYIQGTQPSAATATPGAMWFDTSKPNWPPQIRDANDKTGTWITPNALMGGPVDDGFYLWTWIDVFGAARAAWYDQSGQSRSPAAGRMAVSDFLLVPGGGQDVFAWNGTNWNATDDQFTAPVPIGPGEFNITGVTRSTYPYEIRIPVARINEPYDIRVTRLSDKETKYYFAQINWESFQEISRDVYSFPGLAVSHLTIKATDTFTSLPEFTQIWDGRIIRVPSNYDPVSRLFVGFWDGTWKLAYSNNIAFVAYDLVMNTQYGKNRYFPEVMDPMAVYEFGKHCDAHKFYMNEYITDPRSISETINYIVGTAGGRYVDRGDGYSTILFDADDQPAVALFTPENIIDGLFNYSFTDITARKNTFKVSFVNPLIGWVEDRVSVYDQNSIDAQGYNPEEFIAVGCTDAEEAVRRGRLRLATALTEKTINSFKTNRQGRFLQAFQVVLVADPDMQQIITGRVLTVVNNSTLQLRDEVYLEAGIPLTVTFTVSDGAGGFQIRSYPLSNASGGRTKTLNLATPLDVTLPEKAVFSIGTPRAYRITSIEETEDPDNISITLMEVNRLKWAFVDGLVELDDILALQSGPLSRYTYPPTDLQVSAVTQPDGTVKAVFSWLPSPSQVGGYRVYSSFEGKRSDLISEPGKTTQIEIPNLLPGVYVFTVTSLSVDQTTESAPASIRFVLRTSDSSFRPVVGPSGLRLVDEPQSPIFRKPDAVFAWDASSEPLFSKFRVDVLATNGGVLRTQLTTDLGYTYSLAANKADNNNNPVRNFSLQLRTADQQGNLSDALLLAVSHPAPVAIVPQLSALSEAAVIQFPRPVEADWQGTLIWLSETQGFDPLNTTPIDVGMALSNFIKATPGKTYYIRVAPYDSYSKTGLNISPEYSLKITIQLFDPSAPNIPNQASLTTAAEISPDGTAAAVVNATWTLDNSAIFGKYEVAFAESLPGTAEQDKRYIVDVTNAAAWERHGFIPGRLVSVKQRAISSNGFAASGYSPVSTILAALNTVAPGNPTGFTVTGGFERAYLTWTPGPNRDIDYVEVWAFDGASNASAPPAGAVLLTPVAYGTNYANDVLGTTATRTYWLRSVNTSGTKPTTFTGPVTASSAALLAVQLAAGIIDTTKLASSITAPSVVSSLPTTKTTAFVTLQSDGKLYRWDASLNRYTTAVPAVDVGLGLTAAQIASVNAAAVAGQLSDTQLAAISASKLVGQVVDSQLAALSASKITGQLSDSQLAALSASKVSGQLSDSQLAAISTTKLVGQVVTAQIADAALTLPKFGSGLQPIGTVSSLPNPSGYTGPSVVLLSTDGKVYRLVSGAWTTATSAGDISGQLAAGQIASLAASQITGQLTDAQVAAVAATKITGQLSDTQLASLSASKVSGQLSDTQLAAISASKITGQVVNAQIASGLDGSKLSGVVSGGLIDNLDGAKVLDGTVTASKLVLADTNNLVMNGDFSQGLASWSRLNGAVTIDTTAGTLPAGAPAVRAAKFVSASSGECSLTYGTKTFANDTTQQFGIPCINGEAYYFEAWFYSTVATNLPVDFVTLSTTGSIGVQTRANISPATLPANVWTKVTLTVPSVNSTGRIYPRLISQVASSTFWVSGVRFLRRNGAQLIVDGSIVGTQIAAQAITARTLALSDFQNLSMNGDFSKGLEDWQGGFLSNAASGDLPAGAPALNAGRLPRASGAMTVGSGNADADTNLVYGVPCIAGDSFYFEARVYASIAMSLRVDIVNRAPGGGLGGAGSTVIPLAAGVWTKVSGTLAANQTGRAYLRFYNIITDNSTVWLTSVRWQRMNGAELTVDGTLTATKIVANTITTAQIAAGGVNADRLVANSITAAQIAANTITAGNISAGTLTARELSAGSVTASKLAIASSNVAWNADFSQGLLGWRIERQSGTPLTEGPFIDEAYAPNGMRSIRFGFEPTTTAGSYIDMACNRTAPDGTVTRYPMSPGTRLEVSAYIGLHCASPVTAAAHLLFFNGSTFITETYGNTLAVNSRQGGSIADYPRSVLFATAPANTTHVEIGVRCFSTVGTANGHATAFVSGIMLATGVLATQTEASPYEAPGVTTINGSSISAGSVSADRITANSLTAAQIAAGTITATQIASRTIQAANIVSGTLTANEVQAGSLTADRLAARTITAGYIATQTLTANEVAVGTLTGDRLAANTITATQIAARTITAGNIVSGTLTANEITARTITSAQIATATLTSNEIAANTIVAANIQAGTLTARELAAYSITTSKLAISGTNMAFNPDGSQGTRGLIAGGNSTSLSMPITYVPLSTRHPPGALGSFRASLAGTPAAGAVFGLQNIRQGAGQAYSSYQVVPGITYEVSGYMSCQNCTGDLFVSFTANGNYSEIHTSTQVPGNYPDWNYTAAQWDTTYRAKLIFVAPANVFFIALQFRGVCTGAANPSIDVSNIMLATATPGQTETSPYNPPGTTVIDGSNIVTGSLYADRITAGSITTNQIAARTITAGNIVGGTITGSEIAAATITGTNISGSTITGNNIVGGTITSDHVRARSLNAGNIATGTLTSNEIQAGSISADRLQANTITAAQIAAGAISTAQLAAGAITADKIGIGLSTGNMIYNSDFNAGISGVNNVSPGSTAIVFSSGGQYNPINMGYLSINPTGNTSAGSYAGLQILQPRLNNVYDDKFTVVGGRRYEFSLYGTGSANSYLYPYMAVFDASGNQITSFQGGFITTGSSGNLQNWARSGLFALMPSNAAFVRIRAATYYPTSSTDSNGVTGLYLGFAGVNQSTFSDYTPAAFTVIDGGQISTNSLNASKIVGGSITGDKIQANSVDVSAINADSLYARIINTDGIQASRIVVGGTRLNSWVSGANNTQINGGSIAANSIQANSLRVGARGISSVGISFYSERDGNGNLTNVFCWTGGYMFWTDANNSPRSVQINNGNTQRVNYDGNLWYAFWQEGGTNFVFTTDWGTYLNDKSFVLVATVSGLTGISVLMGGTVIDGTRITAYSIQATQIAANQIQTQHMAANSISGDRIVAGSLAADKISAGTISTGAIWIGSSNGFLLDQDNGRGRIRMFNLANRAELVSIGYLGGWTGDANDFGIILRDSGNNDLAKFSATGCRMTGAIIDNGSIGTAKIGDAQISTAKIANLAVDNLRIAGNAVTQSVSANFPNDQQGSVGLSVRGSGSIEILAFRRGSGSTSFGVSNNNGELQIWYSTDNSNWTKVDALTNPGDHVYDATARASYTIYNTVMLTTRMSLGGGTYYFQVRDTNNANVVGVYIKVTELSK